MTYLAENNRDKDGPLVDIVHAIEAINPPGTSLEVLNTLPEIQALAQAIGFNATKIFQENSLLRVSEIHYIEEMSLVLKQVFIDLQKTETFKKIFSDITLNLLQETHFIVLLKSLLNWLALVNLADFVKEVMNTSNKETAGKFCLFMYNLLKAKPQRSKKHKVYFYGPDIKHNYYWTFDPEANLTVLKQLIKDALRREAFFPVILFLVFLVNDVLNDVISTHSNPQNNFTEEERLEILQMAEQSNSPEKAQIIDLLLNSLKVPT